MEEKLKTLKDLKEEWKKGIINESTIQKQISNNEGIEFSYTGELIPLEIIEGDLKYEAIKRIKHIEEDIKELQNLESKPQTPLQKMATRGLDECLEAQIKEIKMFFNISEEDLK